MQKHTDYISSVSTSSGQSILVLPPDELKRVIDRRREKKLKIEPSDKVLTTTSSDSFEKHIPSQNTHSLSLPSTLSHPEYDSVNFVYYYPCSHFSSFDMRQYYLDCCHRIHFDVLNPCPTITPSELWENAVPIRPEISMSPPTVAATLSSSFSSSDSFFSLPRPQTQSFESTLHSNEESASEAPSSLSEDPSLAKEEESKSWMTQTSWGQSWFLRRVLPSDDPRRRCSLQHVRLFNTSRFKRFARQLLTPNIHWSNHFIGNRTSPYSPTEVHLHGTASVAQYFQTVMGYVPDAVHKLVRSEIFVTEAGEVLVAVNKALSGYKVFSGITEHMDDMTVEDMMASKCTISTSEDDNGGVQSIFNVVSTGQKDHVMVNPMPAVSTAGTLIKMAGRLRSDKIPSSSSSSLGRIAEEVAAPLDTGGCVRKLRSDGSELHIYEMDNNRHSTVYETTFFYFRSGEKLAHRVYMYHSGVLAEA